LSSTVNFSLARVPVFLSLKSCAIDPLLSNRISTDGVTLVAVKWTVGQLASIGVGLLSPGWQNPSVVHV